MNSNFKFLFSIGFFSNGNLPFCPFQPLKIQQILIQTKVNSYVNATNINKGLRPTFSFAHYGVKNLRRTEKAGNLRKISAFMEMET